MQHIDPTIFRAYDIRGIALESLTEEIVRLVGQAFGSEVIESGESIVFIGRDGRMSGPVLIKALSEGLQKSGCHVVDLGMIPTPLLYFATKVLDSANGIMLTGSHNPPNYNGLKMVQNGMPVAGEHIQQIYQRILKNELLSGEGHYRQTKIVDQYLNRVASDIHLSRKLKVVVDAGNGIAGLIGPTLYRRLGCEVIELFCEVDGRFPNHIADPSEPENLEALIHAVKDHQADLGIAFDGDGDRLGLVTNAGEIIWPDRQLMLFSMDVLSRHPGAEIIYDVKCTKFLNDVIVAHGGRPLMWKTGHSFLKEKLSNSPEALLAGEMSGHFFFKERWYGFDDGIYSGARLLEIISKQPESTSAVFKALPNSINTPELRLPISDDKKFSFMNAFQKQATFTEGHLITLDGVRVDFEHGFGLIRLSNTTPYLTLRFEANSESELKRFQALFREQILKVDPSLEKVVPF